MVNSWQVINARTKTTRNYELYKCTDLRKWYVSRVIEPTLSSLEEFQERDSR